MTGDLSDASRSGVLRRAIRSGETHQIPIYLAALAVGALAGLIAPASASGFELAIEPVLATLLYATFLQVPFTAIARAFLDLQFLSTVIVVNFVLVPMVVWALSFFLPAGPAVLLGFLLVLLTPCIDYVIVFAGLAGGSERRLLAAAPLLMLLQLLLLPVYLLMFVGGDIAAIVDPGPFLHAFVVLIVIPLILAVGTELLARRHRLGAAVTALMTDLMVPLLAATLLVVVASQIEAVSNSLAVVARLIPVYLLFAAAMTAVGWAAAKLTRLDVLTRDVVLGRVTTRSD